ncbi:MAG TPA: glycosyl transferase family 2 [Xanthomonadales bacterium]|nr:glycosyl transferase family 2 [Xanthomonadales bacterium]
MNQNLIDHRPRISIVIPVGPGDTAWQALLPDLAALGPDHETILVAAPGQRPAQPSEPDRPPPEPRWIEAPTVGRAHQLNAGADASRGDWLCFLHADSRLSEAALRALEHNTRDPNAMYFFDLRFLDDGPRSMTLNRIGTHIRSRWLAMPFGDQGLTLARTLWQRLGGFDPRIGRGEDHELVWRARRIGAAIRPLRAPIHTSARRYAEQGWLRTTTEHLYLTARQAMRFSRSGGAR